MRKTIWTCGLLLVASALIPPRTAEAGPNQTVCDADAVLREVMAVPVRQIPARLLAQAQGIAIIPNVIKIGFIGAFRRGHGVVMVRGANGSWTLPRFVTLTGGSVGWQAGVQGTDVILVFLTPQSVQGLLSGKFTIGADVAAAAGPVGRNAAAATDFRLKAEILSYSRSRGLFAGVSLDGSAISTDPGAYMMFYGSAAGQPPVHVPESASRLVADVAEVTGAAQIQEAPVEASNPLPQPQPAGPGPQLNGPAEVVTPELAAPAGSSASNVPRLAVPQGMTVRQSLAARAGALYSGVDEGWKRYLALPKEVFKGTQPPNAAAMSDALRQYQRVASDSKYQALTSRPDFQATYKLLGEYTRSLSTTSAQPQQLPPPPAR